MRRLTQLLPLLLLGTLLGGLPTPAPVTVPAAVSDYQPGLPVNATVYYATQTKQASRVHPNKPVDNADVEVIRNNVLDMQYAGQQVGLLSWLGRGSYPDRVFPNHLRAADDTGFRWALLNEDEGQGKNPTVTQAKADLDWIYTRYAKDPSYFRVGGKPVMFLYGDANDTCNAAARWRSADSANRFYLVMKVVSGYTGCRPQPQRWWGYAPANGHFATGNSYAVSPGFNKVTESKPRLVRSVARFATDLRAMKASRALFKITTTWNEWAEATGVESATEWASRSGHGAYVDQMHSILGAAPTTPGPPGVLNAVTAGQDVNLSWSAVAGATSYQVFRNGCLAATVAGTAWSDTTLADASASYFVKAVGARGTSRRGPIRVGVAGTPVAAAPSSSADGMKALPAQRVVSTASGQGVGCAARQRGQLTFTVPASVPANATAVVLAVHAISPFGNGTLTLFPAGTAAPAISQVRYYSTRASSNTTTVPIGTGRQVVVQETGAATHVVVELLGYIGPGEDGIVMNNPNAERVYDSRSTGKRSGATTVTLSKAPAGATAVQLRVLITGAAAGGQLVAYQGGTTRPAVSMMEYAPSVNLVASVLVPVSAAKTVTVYTSSVTNVIVGVEGWVVPGAAAVSHSFARVYAGSARVTSLTLSLPPNQLVLLNLGIRSALGYGNVAVGSSVIQQMSYGPQQPQSGSLWIRVPANGQVPVSLSSGAVLSVDKLALA